MLIRLYQKRGGNTNTTAAPIPKKSPPTLAASSSTAYSNHSVFLCLFILFASVVVGSAIYYSPLQSVYPFEYESLLQQTSKYYCLEPHSAADVLWWINLDHGQQGNNKIETTKDLKRFITTKAHQIKGTTTLAASVLSLTAFSLEDLGITSIIAGLDDGTIALLPLNDASSSAKQHGTTNHNNNNNNGNGNGAITLLNTRGRPKDMKVIVNDATYVTLVIADEIRGLLSVNITFGSSASEETNVPPTTFLVGEVETLAATFMEVNSVDISKDARFIFFTARNHSSNNSNNNNNNNSNNTCSRSLCDWVPRRGAPSSVLATVSIIDKMLGNRPDGMLLRYDRKTNKTTLLLANLLAPGGIALSRAEDFILISETVTARIVKLWLKGPSRGEATIFAKNIPGLPTVIALDYAQSSHWVYGGTVDTDSFWVGTSAIRDPSLDFILSNRIVKKLMAWLVPLGWHDVLFRLIFKPQAMLLRFDNNGAVLACLCDRRGEFIRDSSQGLVALPTAMSRASESIRTRSDADLHDDEPEQPAQYRRLMLAQRYAPKAITEVDWTRLY